MMLQDVRRLPTEEVEVILISREYLRRKVRMILLIILSFAAMC
jgi:hypothetical protein